MTEITNDTAKAVLDLPMGRNDPGAKTVREYLKALLLQLWREGECFGGKRPFGNSGWEYELYWPLVKAGLIEGELDEDDGLNNFDISGANALIKAAIGEL